MSEKTRILVAEDNDFVRMQIIRFLEEADYDVLETKDGKEALDKADATVDVAIVDVRMEPLDGFDFVRSIRGMDVEMPVILVTGDQNADLLSEAAKWGVAAVLMKPVERDRLLNTVSRILQAKARAS